MDICGPLISKNNSQESILLRLFPFFLMQKETRWLTELPNNSIASCLELNEVFTEIFSPPQNGKAERYHLEFQKSAR